MDKLHESPGRRTAGQSVDRTHQAALLIDFDNVTMGIRSNLGQELRNLLNSEVIRGKVAVQRAYADWRRYPQYIVPLSEASIDLIFAPAYGSSKKNATDIRLAIDALELVFVRPEIRTYILMSGDSDFSSLVLKLKEYGKYVIGVGIQESSSDLLVQNCDEYYSYSALTGLSKSGDQPTESHDPWVLVEKAVGKMVERGDTMRSDRLKQVMIEIDPSFNEKEHGFNKFNRFVVEAASRGLVSIQKMENGQYGVAPAAASAKPEKPEKQEKREKPARAGAERRDAKPKDVGGRRRGERRTEERPAAKAGGQEERIRRARPRLTMKSGLDLLGRALGTLLEGETTSVRDSDVKRKILEFDPAFDEGELGFSKFSKFLQAAEEQGAIELSRGPQGNYHVALGKPSAKRKRGPVKRDAEPERDTSQAEGTMQRLARFLFGERRPEEPAKPKGEGAEPEKKTPEDVGPAEPSSLSEAPARRPEAGRRGGRGGRGGRAPADKARAGASADSRPAGRPRRGDSPDRGERRPRGESRGGGRGAGDRRGSGRQRGEGRRQEERRSWAEPEASERVEETARPSPEPSEQAAERAESVAAVRSDDVIREAPPTPPRERGISEPAKPEKPVEAVEAAATADDKSAGAERRSDALSPAPLPGAPRGTIRGRWGTRGRYRPAGAPPPIFEGQKGARLDEAAVKRAAEAVEPPQSEDENPQAAAEASERSTDLFPEPAHGEAKPDVGEGEASERSEIAALDLGGDPGSPTAEGPDPELVNRLTGYAGVGRRTAESLVEAFGADVFRVLDEEPDRVREILPDHRAERVLEERRRELSAGQE